MAHTGPLAVIAPPTVTGGRPRIGVTGPRRRAWAPRACVHLALLLAGATPRHLRPGDAVEIETLDGIVITGGHDIEPVLYRAASEVEGRYDPERDAFESRVLREALARRRPVLAICRGAQLLNVCLGGTLFQDLRGRRRRGYDRRTILPLRPLHVREGTRLMRTLDTTTPRINSLHRQAIDRVGDGLRVSALDRDRIVQAVELEGPDYVLGVQWHPEFLGYLPPHRRLFTDLVRAARGADRAA